MLAPAHQPGLPPLPFVPTEVLALGGAGPRAATDNPVQRGDEQLRVMSVGPAHYQGERDSIRVDEDAAFGPLFPPIRWVGCHSFSRERGFDHRPVHTLPCPGDPFELVVLGDPLSPEPDKDLLPFPVQEVLVDGARAPEGSLGEGLPLDAGAQQEDDRRKDLPGRHPLAPAPGGGGGTAGPSSTSAWG